MTPPHRISGSARPVVIGILIVGVLLVLAWWTTSQRTRPAPRIVTVYGFSALQGVMDEEILPAFQSRWKDRTGQHVEFVSTWTGSAALVERILRELPAQVAFLASGIDAARLERRGVLLGHAWGTDPEAFVLARSPLVLCVRPGNPLGIRGWEDLGGPGVEIVHPDPETSGAGEWGVIAAYAAAERRSGDAELAAQMLVSVWRNVRLRPASARLALRAFAEGEGDVLVTWEREAVEAIRVGRLDAETVLPPVTGIAEHLMVPIPRNLPADQRDVVEALFEHLRSLEVRAQLAEHGFRIGLEPAPPTEGAELLRLEALGGAERVQRRILDAVWRERIRDVVPPAAPPGSR